METIQSEFDIEFGQAGGHSLKLDLYHPPASFKPPYPALAWIHGGGWRLGDKRDPKVAQTAIVLAQAGYLTVSINYRLSPVAAFPAAVHDCKCAIRWLRANAGKYQIDPDRIGAGGRSAGGHLSLMLGTTSHAEFEGDGGHAGQKSSVCGVCAWAAPSDLALSDDEGGWRSQFIGGSREQRQGEFRQASPFHHVSSQTAPTMLIHGEHDDVVKIQESENMFAALKSKGVPCEFVRVKNAMHVFAPLPGMEVEPSVDEIHRMTVRFFDQTVRGFSGIATASS